MLIILVYGFKSLYSDNKIFKLIKRNNMELPTTFGIQELIAACIVTILFYVAYELVTGKSITTSKTDITFTEIESRRLNKTK
jgi:hypothetical protein